MTNILIVGVRGAMGAAVIAACRTREEFNVVAGVDMVMGDFEGIPVYSSFDDCAKEADVVIDFSNPMALDSIISYCGAKKVPAVICTTGFSDEQQAKILKLSKTAPVFKSANMSLGVNLIANLVKSASRLLSDGFDIEIVEKHHRRKVDAPSGTAFMLANEINSVCDGRYHFVYDRESVRQARSDNELGIHSVRGGTIVGEHDVIFAGIDETVTISHSALSRNVFASGALAAASFITEQPPGLYDMNHLIEQRLL